LAVKTAVTRSCAAEGYRDFAVGGSTCVENALLMHASRSSASKGFSAHGLDHVSQRPASGSIPRHHDHQVQSANPVRKIMATFLGEQAIHALPGHQSDEGLSLKGTM
jgi:hypothetical protein